MKNPTSLPESPSSLLFCGDDLLNLILCEALKKFSVNPRVCVCSQKASDTVRLETLDSVVVDWDDPHASAALMEQVRNSDINARSFGVAVVRHASTIKACFASGASYAIFRPENTSQALAALKPVHTMLRRERRGGGRVSLRVPAILHAGNVRQECIVRNLSRTGMCLDVDRFVRRGANAVVTFQLPERDQWIHAKAEVMWSTNSRCGMAFSFLLNSDRKALGEWLKDTPVDHAAQGAIAS